ncbi:MAG TPA: hypothetical protein PLF15_00895 [bacterium]|nr:hypothetical protein [bacterium]
MCGIFGLVGQPHNQLTIKKMQKLVRLLFKLSESRGKEAAGLAILSKKSVEIIKQAASASTLIHSTAYQEFWQTYNPEIFQALIGHARLVTNGSMFFNDNNQPVVKDQAILVHNGIVVNDQSLWQQFPELHRQSEVDTEIIAALINKFLNTENSLPLAIKKTFSLIKGMTSIAGFFNNQNNFYLATNNGSLYLLPAKNKKFFIFASEKHILEKVANHRNYQHFFSIGQIIHLSTNELWLIDLANLENKFLDFKNQNITNWPIEKVTLRPINKKDTAPIFPPSEKDSEISSNFITEINAHYEQIKPQIDSLKRCTKCILPETMPLIEFDEHGVCNYCRHYQPLKIKGEEQLKQLVSSYRKNNGDPDCVMTFSGGRDSSYGLHYVKKKLGLNPVAYSYDWGMITDLARRNQSRMCGQLGVEHILISANIKKKRDNIKKNVLAWLKKPNLGTVPLFMAGDKQYFYYANKISKQIKAPLIVICTNLLEKTYFKTAFCGARIDFNSKKPYALSPYNQLKLIWFYFKNFITNPSYINSSLLDTLGAFISYYFISHKHLNIYQYLPWDENEISETLINQYDWETAPDTSTTWRIGDGTAAFYNYIYYTMAGFTENDTFRSNQIREGVLTREEALKITRAENQPRWPAFRWYCDTIGIDWLMALEKINSAPKLY